MAGNTPSCATGEREGGYGPLMASTSSLVWPQSDSADRSRAARLRVPAGGEEQGRQTNQGRHPTHDDAARPAGGAERVARPMGAGASHLCRRGSSGPFAG